MFNYQVSKNILFSGFGSLAIFSFLLIININTLTLEKISLFSNFDISFTKINLFLIYVILPSLIFLFLQSILLKYIDFLWATSISVLSIISYAGYDFKKFIFDIILNYSNVQNLTPKKIILFEYPNISFSLFIFLLITWISLKIKKFQVFHVILIAVLWSGYSLLSVSGSIIGVLFWSIYSLIRHYRLKRNFLQIFLVFCFNLIFYLLFLFASKNSISLDANIVNNIYNFSLGYFLFYFVGPIILIFLILYFYKIDIYEIFIKFTPIYVLMLSDLIISIYLANNKSDYQNHEFFVYPHFVLHFLYIVPIIYYLNKPLSPFTKNKKTIIVRIQKYIFILFNKISKIYLPLIIFLLLIFSIIPGKI